MTRRTTRRRLCAGLVVSASVGSIITPAHAQLTYTTLDFGTSGTFLTGVRLKKSATDVHAGISIDQAIAREVGHLTRLPSLELTCDAGRNTGACDSGYACAYQNNISWRNENTPMPPLGDPRLVFERLFSSSDEDPDLVAGRALRESCRGSILDVVREDAKARSLDQTKLRRVLLTADLRPLAVRLPPFP